MSADDEELDPRETPDHPRHQFDLIGQHVAEQKLLESYKSGRFHHAWMLCGPQGIGKATLAYRLARFILSNPDQSSQAVIDAADMTSKGDHLVAQRVSARSHSDLFVLQREINRKTKKLGAAIIVEGARKLGHFFNFTAGEGGWRICIIDAADDLNPTAANGILKILEEPPKHCLFIIVSHAPGRLLATIRSRCQRLDLAPLSDNQVRQVVADKLEKQKLAAEEISALVTLSNGSPGRAIQLATSPGARQFIRFQQAVAAPQGFSLAARVAIAEEFQKRGGEIEFNIFADLLGTWVGRNAMVAADQSLRVRANALATCHSQFSDSIARTNALNLDRRQTLMMAFEQIEKILRP